MEWLKLGDRFGRLVILKERKQKAKDGHRVYICKCDCGNLKEVVSRELLNGDTQSCGCYRIEQMVKKRFIEGTQPDRFNGNINKNNKSGIRGVCYDKSRNKWKATITFKRKTYNLGRFDTIGEAEKVRNEAERKIKEWLDE